MKKKYQVDINDKIESARGIMFYLLCFLCLSSLTIPLIKNIGGFDDINNIDLQSINLFLTYIALIVGVVFLMKNVLIKDLRKFDKTDKKIKKLAYFLIIGYLLIIVCNVASGFLLKLFTDQSTSANQEALNSMLNSKYFILTIIPPILFAPIVEELIFRKAIFNLIKKTEVAIIVSCFAFGAIHVVPTLIATRDIAELPQIIVYSVLAIPIIVTYLKSDRNIVYPIALHTLSNLIVTIMQLINSK